LLADGIAQSIDDLAKKAKLNGQLVRLQPTGFEQFAFWITALAPLLLLLGTLGSAWSAGLIIVDEAHWRHHLPPDGIVPPPWPSRKSLVRIHPLTVNAQSPNKDAAKQFLLKEGTDPKYGARHLIRSSAGYVLSAPGQKKRRF